VSPAYFRLEEAGEIHPDHFSGNFTFDPIGLKPEYPEEFNTMVTKEHLIGHLAMLTAAGFLAQD